MDINISINYNLESWKDLISLRIFSCTKDETFYAGDILLLAPSPLKRLIISKNNLNYFPKIQSSTLFGNQTFGQKSQPVFGLWHKTVSSPQIT